MTRSHGSVAQGFAAIERDDTIRAGCAQAFTGSGARSSPDVPIGDARPAMTTTSRRRSSAGREPAPERMPFDVMPGQLPRRLAHQGRPLRSSTHRSACPMTGRAMQAAVVDPVTSAVALRA